MHIIAACALTLTLAGCAGQQAEDRAQAQAAADDALCQAQTGAIPGSQAYIQCRENLDKQHADMRAAQRRQSQR